MSVYFERYFILFVVVSTVCWAIIFSLQPFNPNQTQNNKVHAARAIPAMVTCRFPAAPYAASGGSKNRAKSATTPLPVKVVPFGSVTYASYFQPAKNSNLR